MIYRVRPLSDIIAAGALTFEPIMVFFGPKHPAIGINANDNIGLR